MSYLQTIAQFSAADNLGGNLVLQVARKADIESIQEPVDGVVYGDIIFLPGKGFITWAVISETMDDSSGSRSSNAGASRGNRIPFRIPKGRASLRSMFNQAEEDEFIVLITDANGKKKLFGLLYSPVQFKYDHKSGASHADLNHYACEFFSDGPDNMFEYNGAVSEAPAGPAPVVIRVNGEVIATLSPGTIADFTTDFTYDFTIIAAS